jgi:BMFP domain-containing protein YqiC
MIQTNLNSPKPSEGAFMNFKNFFTEALVKGEALKDELAGEVLKSKLLQDVVRSELFTKAVTKVIKTKEEVEKAIKSHVKNVLNMMDVPSRADIGGLQQKLHHLEKIIDRVGKQNVTVKSLKTLSRKKRAR